jgi:hypothetical protein
MPISLLRNFSGTSLLDGGVWLQNESLPPEMISFIRLNIESISHLEILLLLREVGKALTAAQINEKQRSSIPSIERILEFLAAHGLVVSCTDSGPKTYQYSPSSYKLSDSVNELADHYENYPVRVITAIYSPADPLQSFADAFRFRKETDTSG